MSHERRIGVAKRMIERLRYVSILYVGRKREEGIAIRGIMVRMETENKDKEIYLQIFYTLIKGG